MNAPLSDRPGHAPRNDLTAETVRSLLDYDTSTGQLRWRSRPNTGQPARTWNTRFAGKVACSAPNSEGYQRIAIFGVSYRAHRIAWLHHHGVWPAALLDHANGDRTDNRIANLREASAPENSRNSRRQMRSSSGVKGVYRHTQTGRWVARIKYDGKYRHIGIYPTIEQARAAYEREALLHHGQFARMA